VVKISSQDWPTSTSKIFPMSTTVPVLKMDPKFIDVCENSAYAFDIIDLDDWLGYVVEGHKVFLEKKQRA
jgi:hypothetical protein